MLKDQSLSFHVVSKHLLHKITFLSFPTTSVALLVFIALVLYILRRDNRGKHNFEKQNYRGTYSDNVCQCLNTDQILLKIQFFGDSIL